MPAKPTKRDIEFARACRVFDAPVSVPLSLHPDTSPAAIAAAQREAVLAAVAAADTDDPATLSAVACLPVWTVERRLEELRAADAVPTLTYEQKLDAADRAVREFMAGRVRPVSSVEVSKALGIPRTTVRSVLERGGYARSERPSRNKNRSLTTSLWSQPAVV